MSIIKRYCGLILVTMFILFIIGCTAYYAPRPITESEQGTIFSSPFSSFVLGVQRQEIKNMTSSPYNLDTLIMSFKNLGFFKEVDYMENIKSPADIIVIDYTDNYPKPADCWECLFSVVTLGVFPIVVNRNHTFAFTLKAPRRDEKIVVEFSHKEKSIFGWLAGPIKLSKKWDSKFKTNDFYRLVYLELLRHQNRILEISRQR